jgi:hypothetical protein
MVLTLPFGWLGSTLGDLWYHIYDKDFIRPGRARCRQMTRTTGYLYCMSKQKEITPDPIPLTAAGYRSYIAAPTSC